MMTTKLSQTIIRSVLVLVLFGVGAVVTLMADDAVAQQPSEFSKELSDESVRHYERSIELYKDGRYDEAIDELRAAYSLTPDPMLLYNMAVVHGRSGDIEAARRAALRAKADGLPDTAGVHNDARLRAFRAVLEARDMADAADENSAGPPISEPTPPPAEADPGLLSPLGWTGSALAATGVVSLGGAWWINAQLVEESSPLREAAHSGDAEAVQRFRSTRLDDLKAKQTVGQVLFIGGTLLVSTGATLLLVDLLGNEDEGPRPHAEQPTNDPRISITGGPISGGAAAQLRVQFR